MHRKIHHSDLKPSNQIVLDVLNKEIAKEKRKVKKTTSIFDSFSFLIEEYRKNEVKRKLLKYERLFADSNKNIFPVHCAINLRETERDIYNLKVQQHKRQTVLTKIIEVLKNLSKSYNEQEWIKLKELEKNYERFSLEDANSLINIKDLLISVTDDITEIQNFINERLRDLQKKRSLILRARWNKVSRDIRQSFRNIIRFIFKNMDDQSGEDNKLVLSNLKQQFIIPLKHLNHGKKFDFRTT